MSDPRKGVCRVLALLFLFDAGSALAASPAAGSTGDADESVVFAALIQGDGATGRVCRPLAEEALVRLGALPRPGRRPCAARRGDVAAGVEPARIG